MASKKKLSKAAKIAAAAGGEAQLTRFQAFTWVRVHRRTIKNAPYNPRFIDDDAKARLRAILDVDHGGVGLLGPVTVNEVTNGNLVGGHQRLALLDALEGHDNYLLDVAMVRLTEVQEVEANIALNNDKAQGGWDMPLLAAALKTQGLSLAATAFTFTEVQLSFEDPDLASLFAPKGAAKNLLDELGKTQADAKAQQQREREADGSLSGKDAERAKKFRKDGKERFDEEDDTENYAVLMFATRAEREAFVQRFGLDPDERYVDGPAVVERITAIAERDTKPDNPPPPPKPTRRKAAPPAPREVP